MSAFFGCSWNCTSRIWLCVTLQLLVTLGCTYSDLFLKMDAPIQSPWLIFNGSMGSMESMACYSKHLPLQGSEKNRPTLFLTSFNAAPCSCVLLDHCWPKSNSLPATSCVFLMIFHEIRTLKHHDCDFCLMTDQLVLSKDLCIYCTP